MTNKKQLQVFPFHPKVSFSFCSFLFNQYRSVVAFSGFIKIPKQYLKTNFTLKCILENFPGTL